MKKVEITVNMWSYLLELCSMPLSTMTASQKGHAAFFEEQLERKIWEVIK